MKISDNFRKKGIPYYRGQDISSFFIEQSNPICITQTAYDTPVMKRSYLKKNDILLSIVGTIGKLSLVKEDNKATCSCKLAILRPKVSNSNFLSLFLQSKYGQSQIKRLTRGAVQQGLLLEDMNQIVLPTFSDSLKKIINIQIEIGFEKLKDSKTLYKKAENLLLEELDFLDFKPTKESISIKSFSESFGSSGRLDSEYYLPKYYQIDKKVHENNQVTLIQNEFNFIKTKFDKSKDGYNYIEIGNINVSDGTHNLNYILTEELPANAKINVANGDLLISKVRPNRGAITIINTDDTDLIVSGAFTVLRKKEKGKINTQVLQVLLRTKIYKELLLKYNVGTSYPVIKDNDVLNLVIPIITPLIQTQIESKIKESFRLKEESKRLLELAKRSVEVAIEEGEEIALKFIEKEKI
jgi:type I restriction enzyme S subunit